EDGTLRALDPGTGALRWQFDAGYGIIAAPAVGGDTVFVASRDGFLHALRLADGTRIWRGPDMRTITAAPLAGDGYVCVQGFYGATTAFDSATGRELWTLSLGSSLQSTPIVTPAAVYQATDRGLVYALRRRRAVRRLRGPAPDRRAAPGRPIVRAAARARPAVRDGDEGGPVRVPRVAGGGGGRDRARLGRVRPARQRAQQLQAGQRSVAAEPGGRPRIRRRRCEPLRPGRAVDRVR